MLRKISHHRLPQGYYLYSLLTFLRRRSKSLIDSGTTKKPVWSGVERYLLYALGEIALVVIGVLIALQINNWNEARKESNLEQQYLFRISKDIESDPTFLNKKIELAKSEIVLYQNYIYEAYKTQNDINEYVQLVTTLPWTADALILQDKTYEELTSSGQANLIKNLSLREKITDY